MVYFLVHRHSVYGNHVWWRNNVCGGIKLDVYLIIFLHGGRPFPVHIPAILQWLLSIWTFLWSVNLLLDDIHWSFGMLNILFPRTILRVLIRAFRAYFLTLLRFNALYTFLGYLSFQFTRSNRSCRPALILLISLEQVAR